MRCNEVMYRSFGMIAHKNRYSTKVPTANILTLFFLLIVDLAFSFLLFYKSAWNFIQWSNKEVQIAVDTHNLLIKPVYHPYITGINKFWRFLTKISKIVVILYVLNKYLSVFLAIKTIFWKPHFFCIFWRTLMAPPFFCSPPIYVKRNQPRVGTS